jgi:6-phosphogluconolactonase (cycloisomerase 2 family)
MTNPLIFVSLSRLKSTFALTGLALALSACGGGGNDSGSSYTLGGSVSTLTGNGLILQSNGETLNVAASATSFTFTNPLSGSYDVSILVQPTGETCTVANASGSASGSSVTSVSVLCRPYAVYVADSTGNAIATFTMGAGGMLSAASSPMLPTAATPGAIVVSSDGKHAWVAYQDDPAISSLLIDSAGNLSLQGATSNALSQQDALALSTDGKSLYAAENGAAEISQFTINGSGVASTAPATSVAAGINPSALAATADGTHLYVANASANSVSGYTISASGKPTALATPATSTTAYGTGPKGIAVNPSVGVLYVTLSDSAKVVQYNVDTTTGALTYHASQATGTTPRGITVSPSGNYAYVANYGAGTISQYTLAGGTITPLSTPTVAAGTRPVSIAISPDGGYAYVTNFGDSTISQYSIGANGLLSPLSPASVSSDGAGPISIAVR